MKRSICLILLICVYPLVGKAQKADVPPVFQNQQPLTLSMTFSIKEVKKNTVDSVYIPSTLKFKNDAGAMDSIPVRIRARGNFRRANCFFPPIRMKMKKGDAEKTIFTGNKDFKLVLPCQSGKGGNDLIMKEYLCYKLLEPLTPYHFHTRLADLVLTDKSGKPKTYNVRGFLIEDDDLIAHRFKGKVIEQQIHPMQLNDTASVVNDLFQYLVANTDWSSAMQHNMKVIQVSNKKIPLAYDFDMAGLVNAPYATVNESLPISSVQERLYRGFCRNETTVQYVRSEYLRLEPELMRIISDHQSYFNERDYAGIRKFIEEFYVTLKSDKKFKDAIITGCRTK
ncbi:MAG TPA: hypothetical protein PL167_07835 [Cyclobacteriaceae bacterium]|nr:hypothetical protein [Cyclobacteriaceae bacterium]